MKYFFTLVLGIVFSTFVSLPLAQTDTGGGMGGTGVKSQPITPAQSEEECTREKSIGVYQLKSLSDNKIKKQGYVCEGQMLITSKGEHSEIHMRNGMTVKLLESSKMIISNQN